MTTASTRFRSSNPIEVAICRGDFDGVLAALRALTPAQRDSHRVALRQLEKAIELAYYGNEEKIDWWGGKPDAVHSDCAKAALFFCGSEADQAEAWLWNEALMPALSLLDPVALRRLADTLIRSSPRRIGSVQKLIAAGLSDRPDCEEYTIGLICAPRIGSGRHFTLLSLIDADPGLVDGPLLRVFEVEGSGEINMAGIEKYEYDKTHGWSATLLELVRRGVYSRAQLLELTIGTLERDWPQFRAGWFSRFHAALAPTPQEMAPLSERYLGLCHSRIAPTVSLALAALALLFKHGLLGAGPLLEALRPAMSSAVKGQIDSALKLLDAIVKQSEANAHAAAALLPLALLHESAELHQKAIARLAAWGFDDATGSALAAAMAQVSAANRTAMAALIACTAQAPSTMPVQVVQAAQAPGMPPSPLGSARALAPIDTLDALVQALAFVFENEGEGDQFERVLDGLSRLVPFSEAALARLAPVLKRARTLLALGRAHERPLGTALARFLCRAADGGDTAPWLDGHSVRAALSQRIDELLVFCRQGHALPALAAATHLRGFIDPAVLVTRIEAHARAGACSAPGEQLRALLRLPAGEHSAARARARLLPASELAQALRYALGDEVARASGSILFDAAASIRDPARHHFPLFEQLAPSFHGSESALWYAASLLPSQLDAFFACGAVQIAINLDWWEARWHDKAYVALLLDPTVAMGAGATALLATALGGKEPGQTALAIDALVAVVADGRFDALALGADIRRLLLAGSGKAARYAKALASAARAGPALAPALCALLCEILAFAEAAPPRDVGRLLELLLELSLGHALVLAPDAVAAIASLALSGKARLAQKALLAQSA